MPKSAGDASSANVRAAGDVSSGASNCRSAAQTEAQREFGLTPDDVHDSFNFWMHTGVDPSGRLFIKRLLAREGDYVELLAQIDTLAVPNVCGADVFATSNFELKPLKIQVLESTDADREQWLLPEERQYASQRSRTDFRVKEIKSTPELIRDEGYEPQWGVYPIVKQQVEVELSKKDLERVEALRATGDFGETDAEIVRYAFFSWWIERFMGGPKHFHAESRR
jgi:hypothetical protein